MESLFVPAVILLATGIVFHLTYAAVTGENFVRNRAIGIRTRSTLSSDEAWRDGHRAAAPYLLATALVAYASAVVCAVVAFVAAGDGVSDVVVGVVPGIGFLSILVLAVHAARVANKAARSPSSERG